MTLPPSEPGAHQAGAHQADGCQAGAHQADAHQAGGCQAGGCYSGLVCFRGRVETCGPDRVRKESLACAKHLGLMVLALTAWVHEQQLTDARLTVLAIDPAAHPAAAADGFEFITWRVTG